MLDFFGFCGLRGSVLFVWAWSLSLRALLSRHFKVTDGDCRLYYTIDMSLHNSYISFGKSDLHVAYPQIVSDVLLVSTWWSDLPQKSGISLSGFILYACCECIVSWVFIAIAAHWTVTNWSSLEVVYRTFLDKPMCEQTSTHWPECQLRKPSHLIWNM